MIKNLLPPMVISFVLFQASIVFAQSAYDVTSFKCIQKRCHVRPEATGMIPPCNTNGSEKMISGKPDTYVGDFGEDGLYFTTYEAYKGRQIQHHYAILQGDVVQGQSVYISDLTSDALSGAWLSGSGYECRVQ